MEVSHETNQILQACKEKEYTKTNSEALRVYFTAAQNINELKLVLTTNRNFLALRIVESLDLKILPYIYINTHTYTSLFWLCRMNAISTGDFRKQARKFQVLKNFDVLERETEQGFIRLQIQKKRRLQKRPCVLDGVQYDSTRFFGACSSMTFFFLLDDLINIEEHIEPYMDIKNSMFQTGLKTLEEYPNEPDSRNKQQKFRELRNRLQSCPLRSFSCFFNLNGEEQEKVERLMNAIGKIKRSGFRYYVCSRRPLASALTFCYLFVNAIDLTKIVEISEDRELDGLVVGRRVMFGGVGNVQYEFLEETTASMGKYMKEYSC